MSIVFYKKIYKDIAGILEQARRQTVKQVNVVMVHAYWQIGKRIVLE